MGWALEISRMALYLAFPVALFHFVNHSDATQRAIFDLKQEMEEKENRADAEVFDAMLRDLAAGKINTNIDQFEQLRAKARADLSNETSIE